MDADRDHRRGNRRRGTGTHAAARTDGRLHDLARLTVPADRPNPDVPAHIRGLADERALARAGRDWATADRLRAEIEAAGWKVVDGGFSYLLEPAHPATIEASDGHTRYGRSADVPSRLDDEPVGLASIVLVATDWPADLRRTLVSLEEHAPDGVQVVIVGDGVPADEAVALEAMDARDPGQPGIETEVVLTSERLGTAAALNAGIRRAAAPVVIVLDTSIELTGDAITPLAHALHDPSVAVAGPFGIVSADLRRFEDAGPGDVTAIEGYVQAFRRVDASRRGPLDEHFRFYRNLDIWWSLVLRDASEGVVPRRALALDDLPVRRHEHRGWTGLADAERDRLSKRNFYRILDRFGSRRDLAAS